MTARNFGARRYFFIIVALVTSIALYLIVFTTLTQPDSAQPAWAKVLATSLATTVTPTPSPGNGSQQSNQPDNSIPTAIIALVSSMIGALITGMFALLVPRYNAYLTRKNALLQEAEAAKRLAEENEKQLRETREEAVNAAKLHADTINRYVQNYYDALRGDPRIAQMKILEMSRPVEVLDLYVPVRLQQKVRATYEMNSSLREVEALRDPRSLLRASRMYFESPVSLPLDLEEIIRKYKYCVIVGDPGAGKSTLLSYLALKSIDQQFSQPSELPVHIDLNAFTNSGKHDILEFVATMWEMYYGFPKNEAYICIKERLASGNVLLLLDGLDETVIGDNSEAAESSYRRVIEAIETLATCYHQSHIIVTARKADYQQRLPLQGFTELELLDFRLEDIEQFINKWFTCFPNPQSHINAIDLKARLMRNPRILALASNPLMLSLIVIVYEAHLDLPDNRSSLYKQCVDTLLTKWDASRGIRRNRKFKPEHKLQLLEEIAWYFHKQKKRYFPENELLMMIAGFLPAVNLLSEQCRQVLEEITTKDGLLKELAREQFGFLHLTLQEYFVALKAVDHNQLDSILMHRGDPWWEEVILLYAGRTPDASLLLQALLGESEERVLREDIFHTNLLVSGRCLGAYPTVRDIALRSKVVTLLFEILVSTPFSLTREQVANTLAEIGGRDTNARLRNLLSNNEVSIHVRISIAYALGTSGEHVLAPDLLPLLSDNQIDPEVRENIAFALGTLGERSVAPDLLVLLSNDKITIDIRKSIALALGALGERSVASALLPLLSDDKIDPNVRGSIAYALGTLGEHVLAPDLLPLLSDNQIDPEVRENIAFALGTLGERSVAPDLLALLSDNGIDSSVRGGIAFTLGTLGEHSIIPNLLSLLSNPTIPLIVRGNIALALGLLGDPSAIPVLQQQLFDRQVNWTIRSNIALALGVLGKGDITLAPKLLRLLFDPQTHWAMQRSIALALGTLGERSLAYELLNLLSDQQIHRVVCRNIAQALGVLSEHSMAADLLELLCDQAIDPDIRQSIALALGMLEEHSVVPKLRELLSDQRTDPQVRQSILFALEQMADDEETIRILALLLQKPDNLSDNIYHALWILSRRAGVWVFVKENGQEIETVKW